MTDTVDYREAISETLEILQFANEEIINKIPLEIFQKLNSQKSITYIPKFKDTQEIREEQISEKAKAILAVLYRDYICSEEERQKFDKKIEENECKNNDTNNYTIEKFNKKDTKIEYKNALPVEVKKSFIKKMLEKIFK